jgi:hypothetical protein
MNEKTRVCPVCFELKPEIEFWLDYERGLGMKTKCDECSNYYNKSYKTKNNQEEKRTTILKLSSKNLKYLKKLNK